MDDDLIYIAPIILLHVFQIIFSGIVAFKKITFKGAKTENLNVMFAILVLMIDLLVFIELNGRIHPLTDTDNIFSKLINDSFSIGLGMYLIITISIIQFVSAIISSILSSKSVANP
jgi:hypothetical protein